MKLLHENLTGRASPVLGGGAVAFAAMHERDVHRGQEQEDRQQNHTAHLPEQRTRVSPQSICEEGATFEALAPFLMYAARAHCIHMHSAACCAMLGS